MEIVKTDKEQDGKVIPILPCPDIRAQVAFYEQLGFEILGLYTSPNPYAAIKLGAIELNFYGTRKMVPTENPSMCFVKVADVDAVYLAFAAGLKQHTGKVPRSGIPRITKVRDLRSDRRFTLTDTGGNTLYVGSPMKTNTGIFFRTLENEAFAKNFAVLYDLIYSKEDCSTAANMLPKLVAVKDLLDDLDKAKLLLVAIEIQGQLGQPVEDTELRALLEKHHDNSADWEKIQKKYFDIIQEE